MALLEVSYVFGVGWSDKRTWSWF